jgi:hypothetical protein
MNREINKRFCVIFMYDLVSKLVPLHIKPAATSNTSSDIDFWFDW